MAKQLHFEYQGQNYVLEYTRRTVRQMESEGFKIAEVGDFLMTGIPTLFAGAFKAHHKAASRKTIEEIYALLPDKEKLLEVLGSMYNDTLTTLMAEPSEEGKVEWTVTE